MSYERDVLEPMEDARRKAARRKARITAEMQARAELVISGRADDADKLRHIADYLDLEDAEKGVSESDMQDFLRELADRLPR